ncbi:Hypothetical predicted protein [Cloeon dipterum]|uniref:F-box/LRR-repeat protein 15-like leucin rich repeat domain-containing protein n=1 Tax=Cloeon dipterum TaxID=197152 RepID=A0A8S1DB54_9INSE|nr:Hypothetical predicted protein [Cloeon dipterum]
MVDEYFTKIRRVNLSQYKSFTPAAFKVLSTKAINIRHLNLANCKWITDELLAPVFENNKHLTFVNLSNICTGLTAAALQPLILNCKELKILRLHNCHWVTHGSIEALSFHQTELEEIDLTSCSELGDTALTSLLEKFRNLRILCLCNVSFITDQTLFAIASYSKKLQHLNLRGCWRITDIGLRSVGEYCVNLKSLMVFIDTQPQDAVYLHQGFPVGACRINRINMQI